LTIIPILRRELNSAARRGVLQQERASFASILLVIVLGNFAVSYYSGGRFVGRYMMSQIAEQAFILVFGAHLISLLAILVMGALSIAAEMDRKTLGFLLATRLNNAEIVLGKLAACGVGFFASLAAGLPIVMLLNALGGVDPRLILLAYGGLCSTAFLVVAVAIFVSSAAPDSRRAVTATMLWLIAWFVIPVFVGLTPILARIGLRPPGFVLTLNAWVLSSNPITLLPMFIRGSVSPVALYYTIGWMSGLQFAGGVVLVLAAIARLRSAFRVSVGGDGRGLAGRLTLPVWRFRPRPPVGDDPIFWRERYTTRGNLIGQLAGMSIAGVMFAALAYFTFFYARRAFVELWHNGYSAGATAVVQPEFHIFRRLFYDEPGVNAPLDSARIDFNLFLRYLTVPFVFVLTIGTAGLGVQAVNNERAKETWSSLIATPLSAREILRSKLRACIWRIRGMGTILFVMWTLGVLSGAIHPLGYLATVLIMASWTWLFLVSGMLAALKAKDLRVSANVTMTTFFLPIVSTALPFLLPAGIRSVVWGAGSTPFLASLSLASYRELRGALDDPVYHPLHWFKINTGDGPLLVALACLIGIVMPALWGRWIWLYSIANFDRLVGRPWKEGPVPAESFAAKQVLAT
jgi:ABC-type transport system involved in multi-copper enzyme maturation permease subunit